MIFVDTSAFFAVENRREAHHKQAMSFKNGALEAGRRFFTSDYVLNETYTLLRKRIGHHAAVKFGEDIRASRSMQILHVTPELIEEAWKIFKKFSDHRFSFTECMSFTLMKRMRVETAFTFDSDFRAFGFSIKP